MLLLFLPPSGRGAPSLLPTARACLPARRPPPAARRGCLRGGRVTCRGSCLEIRRLRRGLLPGPASPSAPRRRPIQSLTRLGGWGGLGGEATPGGAVATPPRPATSVGGSGAAVSWAAVRRPGDGESLAGLLPSGAGRCAPDLALWGARLPFGVLPDARGTLPVSRRKSFPRARGSRTVCLAGRQLGGPGSHRTLAAPRAGRLGGRWPRSRAGSVPRGSLSGSSTLVEMCDCVMNSSSV